jgi:diaminopimelate epimerase
MKLNFTKAEALGNDYILIDIINNRSYYSLIDIAPTLSQRLSDRHFGIGGDGVIFILPSEEYDCEMRIFNSDGSEAEMCGNGIRQVAKYYIEHISGKENIKILTKAGLREIKVLKGNNETKFVVDMGIPILEASKVPLNTEIAKEDKLIDKEFDFGFLKVPITTLSMGNPHCVIFVEDLGKIEISEIGPKIEHHSLFPNRVNVEFVKIVNSNEISMRVWERGSGETMACGTGACASAVATMLTKLPNTNKLTVHLLGGDLIVEWNKENNHVYMTGGANLVFYGTMELKI